MQNVHISFILPSLAYKGMYQTILLPPGPWQPYISRHYIYVILGKGHLVTISAKLFSTLTIDFRADFLSFVYRNIQNGHVPLTAVF